MDEIDVNATTEGVVDSQGSTEIQGSNVEDTSVNSGVAEQKPQQSYEDNARFADVRRKAEQSAKDAVIAEMYGSQGINTYSDYQKALETQREAEQRQAVIDSGYDPDILNKMIENHPSVKYANELRTQKEVEAANSQRAFEFFKKFPGTKPEELPRNVIDAFENGGDMVAEYSNHIKTENEQLKQKLNINNSNARNAEASTGSVTGNGAVDGMSYTREQVSKMSQSEVSKNYNNIIKSMKNW